MAMAAEADSVASQQTLDDSVLLTFVFDPPLDVSASTASLIDGLMHRSRLSAMNPAGCALFGGDFTGQSMWELASRLSGLSEPPSVYLQRLDRLIEANFQLENLSSMTVLNGRPLYFATSYFSEFAPQGLARLMVIHHPDRRGHSQDDIVIQLSQELANHSGESLLHNLVVNLSAVLGMRYGMVAQVVQRVSGTWASTRVLSDRGALQPSMDYPLLGTPCEQAASRETCLFPERVQELFPDDAMLVEMGIQSYVGVPLIGADGCAIGILSLFHDAPVSDMQTAQNLLLIFAVRAAAELDWLRFQQVRKFTDERRRVFFEQSRSGMYVLEVDPPMAV